jgi:hypothetical protein
MTEQPYAENLVSKLQPLNFRLVLDDGVAAVFQAPAVGYEQREVPVYTVTVTIAASARREADKQLQEFLGRMQAGFELLPELPPDDGSPDDEEPFDISKQIQIELNLVSLKGDGPVGVAAVVETSIGPGQAALGGDPEVRAVNEIPLPVRIPHGGKDHYWYAYCNRKLKGTVDPSIGSGSMRNPPKNVNANKSDSLTARQIIVHSSGGMTYSFTGSFSGPHSGPYTGGTC